MNGVYYPIVSEPSSFSDGAAVMGGEGIASVKLGETLYHDWDIFPITSEDIIDSGAGGNLDSDSYIMVMTIGSLCFVYYYFIATTLHDYTIQWTGLPIPVDLGYVRPGQVMTNEPGIEDYREFGNTLGIGWVKIDKNGNFWTYAKTQKKRISGCLVYPFDIDASRYKNKIYRYGYGVITDVISSYDSEYVYTTKTEAIQAAKIYFQNILTKVPRVLYYIYSYIYYSANGGGYHTDIYRVDLNNNSELLEQLNTNVSNTALKTALNHLQREEPGDGYYLCQFYQTQTTDENDNVVTMYNFHLDEYDVTPVYGTSTVTNIIPL